MLILRGDYVYRFVSQQLKIKTIFDIFVWTIKPYKKYNRKFEHAPAATESPPGRDKDGGLHIKYE